MNYRVLITTSGIGSRLGELTKYTNKALVRVGKKPVLSYIIEAYPEDTEFVITLGYFGNQVKDFLELTYPDHHFNFVPIDKYQGEGSSLGYSILCAKDFLQSPFIFHACDTIVDGPIPFPLKNWNGGYAGQDSLQYSSFKVKGDGVQLVNSKGAEDFDYLHIGLVGIKDYQKFWRILKKLYKNNPSDRELNDCKVINLMLDKKSPFKLHEFKVWHDVGNPDSLVRARRTVKDSFENLDKVDQATFIFDDFVIKFFADENIILEKMVRAYHLGGLIPEIEGAKRNFLRYKYIEGDLFSRVVTPVDFIGFLGWCKDNLWRKAEEVNNLKFNQVCYDFYYHKTKQRVEKLMSILKLDDQEDVINNEKVPPLKWMFDKIDFNWLANGEQSFFHGDLILENIIKTTKDYKLIDWRQNFGGLLKAGDIYYDFSKLNHNLTINHDIVNNNLFVIDETSRGIVCDIYRRQNLVECQNVLFDFLEKEKLDVRKVKILTAIIWLNMSPLHHDPFNRFLFYFGKLNLWREIQKMLQKWIKKDNNVIFTKKLVAI